MAAWVWQGCHTLLHLWTSVSSVGGFSQQEVLCVPCVLRVYLFSHGFRRSTQMLGCAEFNHGLSGLNGWQCANLTTSTSHHLNTYLISPHHHLTTTTSFHHLTISTPFHFEPSLLQVCPELWVRLRYHLRLVDAQPREHNSSRRERHRHAVVVVRVDRL